MEFWKEHMALRLVLMLVTFVIGLITLFVGWRMTGELKGLGIMLVGLGFLLSSLALYNKPYQ